MAEGEPGWLDAALDRFAGGVARIFEPADEDGFFHKWFSIEGWLEYAGEKGISRALIGTAVYLGLFVSAAVIYPALIASVWGWLLLSAPLTLPVAATLAFWSAWLWYVQSLYIFSRTNPVLLEVRMPAEITKSPRAMEVALTSFWIRSGTTTLIDTKWAGGVLPYVSLELCSFGGDVRFYIWCRRAYKNVLESAIYAQYPEVEIVEVEDYASAFEYDPEKNTCFVTDYTYENYADDESIAHSDLYPIRTYIDFELDKDPKEEHKVEPYASVLEVLSAMNKDEQAWIQIVLRGCFDKKWYRKVVKEVDRIRDMASQGISLQTGDVKQELGFPRPTPGQMDQMRTLERHSMKLIFDVGMRGIYIAPVGKMRSPEFSAFRWIWRPFNSQMHLNGIRPRRAHNDFDYPWQDWKGVRWNLWTRRYLDMYRRRQFFQTPWHIVEPPMRMSAETIATLWHPPSRTVQTPGLRRIPVSKAEAPPNLPK